MVRLATLSAVLVVAVVLLLLPAATDARGRVGLRRSQPRNHFSVKQPLSVLSTNPSRSAKEDEGKAAAAAAAPASAAGSKQQKPASSLRARRAAATQPTVASHVVPEPGGFEVFWAANLTGNRPRFVLRGYNTSRPNVYYTLSLSNVNYVASTGITEGIDSIVVADTMDSNQNSVVYALPASNASKALYLSKDSGQTFNKFVLPFHPVYLEAKPHSSLDVVMLMAPTQISGIFSLYTYTAMNLGASPVLVSNNVLNASFLSNGTIMYIRLAGSVPILSVYFPDAKKSVDVLKNCDGFLEMGIYLFAETVDPVTHALTLYVSSPTGPTPNTFYVTTFPIQGDIMWFDIVDGGFNTALVVAHHAETKMQGDFFISVGSVNVSTWKADFSPDFNASITTAEFVVFGQDNPGCNADYGWANVKGKIVFVPRGQCKFIEKAQLAEMNGAIAIVIINYNDTTLHMIAPDTDQRPTIPVFAVKYSEGYALTHSVSGAKKAVIYQGDIGKQIVNYHTALYQSDNTGLQYSVSLKDLFDGTDVTRVLSQRNTFLSNFINDDDQVSTLISFNRVASWDYLDKDSDPTNGLHIDVAGDSGVPPPAFSTGAAGIVLANGFRGPGIDYDHPEDSFLHVSLDGGYNWTPANVRDIGPYTAHVINDGTVFVAASAFSDTAVIEFSIDEGNTWATVNLPGVGPDVYFAGMFPEPGVSSMVSYAYLYNTTSGTWIGYTLNFQPMLPTPCNVKTDFTRYTPSDSDGAAGCAMGSSVTYFRRSPSKTCYISSYPAPIYAQCPCKATDYMCAPGYMRSQEIGDDNALLCKRDNSYYPDKCLTTEYLPIPGSSCLLGNFALPYNTCGSSPSTGKKGMSDGAVAAIVLVVLIVVAVLALLAVKYRNKFSGMFAAGGRRDVPYGNVQNPHDDDDEDMLTT